jgi:hypothetical protein
MTSPSPPASETSWQSELHQVIAQLEAKRRIQSRLGNNPTWNYDPSPAQLACHQSSHPVRFVFPGNGWGKTSFAGHEIAAWMTHSNRWRQTPRRRITGLWFCPEFKQFDLLRPIMIEECWGPSVIWQEQKKRLVWPNGNMLYLASHGRTWAKVQGIPLDFAVFDEHFKFGLYREMMARRRGKRKTELVIVGTMTLGKTWEYATIYKPWLDYHAAKGIKEGTPCTENKPAAGAIAQQLHPDLFCWPYGGIDDNRGMDAEDKRWYRDAIPWGSEKERLVRLGGGFQDWNGDAVFDDKGIAWMKQEMERLERERPTWIRAGTFRLKDAA